jgi:T5SS/PEP-CTERM-associated repeat protein/autotransporter-associated beta strand protein
MSGWGLWAFLAVATTAAEVWAADRTWDNGAGTNEWFTPANWNPDGSPASSDNLTIIAGTPQTATAVSVSGGGSIRLNGTGVTVNLSNFTVGNSAGNGTLTIDRGVLTSGYSVMGSVAGSTGVANLSGSSSAWNTQASQPLFIGYGGTGNVNVSTGADLTVGGYLELGGSAGASGALSLSDSGSTLTVASYTLVGYFGTGTINVTDSADVASDDVYLGYYGGGVGTLTLSGSGSTWSTGAGSMAVGSSGQGTLNITGGAQLTSSGGLNNSTIATMEGSQGTVTVDGSGSTWTVANNNYLDVGYRAVGSLTITNGAVVSCGYGTVGPLAGGQGTAVIDGPGSEWRVDHTTASANLVVGNQGLGLVTVRNRGKVYVDGNLTIGAYGTVNLSGGTLDVDTLGGEGRLNFTSGTLKVTAGSVTVGGSQPLGNSVTLNAGDLLSTSAGITIDPGATLRLYGADAQTTTLTNNGALYITSGGKVDASAGLTNRSFMSMANGTIAGSGGSVVNDYGATLQASGSIVRPLINNGTATLQGVLSVGGAVTNAGLIEIGPSEALQLSAGSTNTGTVALSGGAVTGSTLVNSLPGTLRGSGSVSSGLTNNGGLIHADTAGATLLLTSFGGNTGGGELRVDDRASLTVVNSFSNEGLIALGGPGAVLASGTLTNQNTIRGAGRLAAPLTNNGTLAVQGGTLTLAGAATNPVTGRIEIERGATLLATAGLPTNGGLLVLRGGTFDGGNWSLTNAGTVTGHGTLRVAGLINNAGKNIGVGGGDLEVIGPTTNNGTVTTQAGCTTLFYNRVNGTGSFPGPGTVVFLDSFTPGLSPAVVPFGGDVVFAGSSRLEIELGGTDPGTQYDRVQVAGKVTLDGTLQVSLINPPFRPAHNDRFTVLTFASRTGDFATKTGLDLGSRLQLIPEYTPTSLVLTVSQGGSGTWRLDQSGSASVPANWSGGLPNGIGDVATLGPVITQARTVTVDAPTTWGGVVFESLQKYTLDGSSALRLQVASGSAVVEVRNGSHAIAALLILDSPSRFHVAAATDTLTVRGPIGGSNGLTKSGAGVMDVLGTIAYGGDTTVSAGELRVLEFNLATAGTAHIDVQSGASLVANCIQANTLTIGSGAAVTIRETTGHGGTADAGQVPEPSSLALLAAGAIGLLAFARRRRRSA